MKDEKVGCWWLYAYLDSANAAENCKAREILVLIHKRLRAARVN
jgi:hypothetical protein